MKGYAETIQEQELSSIRSSVKAITGRPFRQMLRPMLRCVISVNASTISLGNHQSTSPR